MVICNKFMGGAYECECVSNMANCWLKNKLQNTSILGYNLYVFIAEQNAN